MNEEPAALHLFPFAQTISSRQPILRIPNCVNRVPKAVDLSQRCPVQKRIAFVVVVLTAVLAAGSIGRTQSSDPWVGTWKINLEKSTWSPGPKPTVASTAKLEPSAGGLKSTVDGTNAEGKPTHSESVANFDGKDNPVKGAQTPNTTIALKRIDDRTYEVANKVDGKPTITGRVAVSADGKTMTITQTGRDAKGQTVKNVIVTDRQ